MGIAGGLSTRQFSVFRFYLGSRKAHQPFRHNILASSQTKTPIFGTPNRVHVPHVFYWDIIDQLQGSFGLFGPKSEKSLERGCWGLSASGAPKVRKQSEINSSSSLGDNCERWISESRGLPERNVLGIVFGNGINLAILLCVVVIHHLFDSGPSCLCACSVLIRHFLRGSSSQG